MKRSLLRWFRRSAPEPIRGPLRAAMQWSRRRRPMPMGVAQSDECALIATDEGIQLRVLPEALRDAEFQFSSDRDSAMEMKEFIQAAGGNSLLYDVGAHIGIFSVVFCLARIGNRAVAFEPASNAVAQARAHIALNGLDGLAEVRAVALGDVVGVTQARFDPAGFAHLGPASEASEFQEISVTTVDAESSRRGEDPDLIKIDVEGFELRVIDGARELLRRAHPRIFLELHLDEIERQGEDPRQVLLLLEALGYQEFRIAGERRSVARICDAVKPVIRLSAI